MSPAMASRATGSEARVANAVAGPGTQSAGNRPTYASTESRSLLPTVKLAELLEEIAPGEVLDRDVEEFIQEHIDGFVDSVTEFACKLAKHRNSRTLDARDVQLHLEKHWNIRIPGYGDDPKPIRRVASSPVHHARLQAIARSQHQHH